MKRNSEERKKISVRSPGRVNLIGGHTDYNGGYVLPAALNLEIKASGAPRRDGVVEVRAPDIGESASFLLDEIRFEYEHFWINYIKGVALYLQREGARINGADIEITGNIPRGAGLSSSAALEVAAALVFRGLSGFELGPVETALLCQRAENEFVGMKCGIMDQFACCLGRKGSAILIDCMSRDFRYIPFDDKVKIVVCDTGIKRELASSEYNRRRRECERAVEAFGRDLPGIKYLREVSVAEFEKSGQILPDDVYRRARHVVYENERVLRAARTLENSDYESLGKLLSASHASLRDDFEVSCRELDLMAGIAESVEGVFGARMTGAGFGGCTVNLVSGDRVSEFSREVSAGYRRKTGISPAIYVCESSDGAGFI